MHESKKDENAKRQEFERLVRENQSGLLGFLISLTGNLADGEDLAQECITVLWRKFDEFELGSNFGAWARTTAFFLFQNHSRKASRKDMTFNNAVLEQVALAHNRPESEGSTRQRHLSECLAELREEDRELILSRYETGRTVGDLAARAGCTAKSVYNALARIRQSLAECVRRKSTMEREDAA